MKLQQGGDQIEKEKERGKNKKVDSSRVKQGKANS